MNIAINGFGRIGRMSLRVWLANMRQKSNLVAINTSGSMDLEGWAHLLRYDSNYGKLNLEIQVSEHQKAKDATDADPFLGTLTVDGVLIQVLAQKDPAKLPWKNLNINTVIESTGKFVTKESASGHLLAGAKRVIISAPPKGEGVETQVIGVSPSKSEDQTASIISNASCTTNCAAPVMAVLQEKFGVKKAMLTTIHAYTDDQNLHDNSHRDLRRARAAGKNIVPTSTGAAISVTQVIPSLSGLFDGLAIRVPVSTGSLCDLNVMLEKSTTVEEVNAVLTQLAGETRWRGILAVTSDPIVSSDIIGRPESAIVDLGLTQVVGGDFVKVIAWYDNEWGYCNRLIEQASH